MHHLLFIPKYHPIIKMKYIPRRKPKIVIIVRHLNAFLVMRINDIPNNGDGISLNRRQAVIRLNIAHSRNWIMMCQVLEWALKTEFFVEKFLFSVIVCVFVLVLVFVFVFVLYLYLCLT